MQRVPSDFEVPLAAETAEFVLVPLGPEHNAADLEAWSSSVSHIRTTPGFAGRSWPDDPMTLERNGADIRQHVVDFEGRDGFTYTVLARPGGYVVGCVYVYPPSRPGFDVQVRSWVRSSRSELDGPLYRFVIGWLTSEWPFEAVDYAPRPDPGASPRATVL